jgi:hypothetical protein
VFLHLAEHPLTQADHSALGHRDHELDTVVHAAVEQFRHAPVLERLDLRQQLIDFLGLCAGEDMQQHVPPRGHFARGICAYSVVAQ